MYVLCNTFKLWTYAVMRILIVQLLLNSEHCPFISKVKLVDVGVDAVNTLRLCELYHSHHLHF